MKKSVLQLGYGNKVSVNQKSSYGAGMFIKTFLMLLVVCVTCSSFKKDAASTSVLTPFKKAAGISNPTPMYAFAMFNYDYTDLNGNDFGTIEIDFVQDGGLPFELDSPVQVFCMVGPIISGVLSMRWDGLKYCTSNMFIFATGVPMGDASYGYVAKIYSPDGDFIPM